MDQVPTEPFRKLLDRDLAKVTAKPIIDVASPLLIEVINHATMAYQRCHVSAGRDSSTGATSEHFAPLMLYQHMIEMADGLESLISSSCSGPALLILRTMLEALLSLDYMLQEDYRKRSLSWLCSCIHKRIEAYELLDPTTDRGRELKKTLEKEGNSSVTGFSLSENVQGLQRVLVGDLAVIEDEYQRQKKSRRRTPHWYSLFDGPTDLRGLAVAVSRASFYDLLYRSWSSVMHATDASRFLSQTSDGAAAFQQIRYPENLKDYTWLAVNFVVISTGMMIQKFRPGENLSPWYNTEVKARLGYLANVQVEINSIQDSSLISLPRRPPQYNQEHHNSPCSPSDLLAAQSFLPRDRAEAEALIDSAP
jgi:hypothetical protein